MILPVFLLLATGMTTFGVVLNQYLELTNATAIGAQQLAIMRGVSGDACANTVTAIENAAPMLANSSLSYQIIFTAPASYPSVTSATYPSSGTSNTPSCSSASTSNMGPNGTVELIVTYPCALAVYGANLIPDCTLHAQVTEMVE